MTLKKSFFVWICMVFLFMLNLPTEAYGNWFKKHRKVNITWIESVQKGELKIIVGNKPKDSKIKKFASFKLKKTDSVTINLQTNPELFDKIDIKYEVKDPEKDPALTGSINKLFGITDKEKATEAGKFITKSIEVVKKLKPGGKLSITFTMINNKGDEEVKTVREVEIEIAGLPKYFTSTGFVFSDANYRELAIIKTSTKVSYEKDGKTMEGYEQKLVYKNDSERIKAREAAVQFLHYKVGGPIYFTVGTPLNEKIFKEAFCGFSGLLNFRGGGLVINLGIYYHKELKIMEGSGFEINQTFPPSNELTLDDINTENEPVIRYFIGLSFRL